MISVLPFALLDETPWFLVARPRDLWVNTFEPLSGEVLPGESPAHAAHRIAEEHGFEGIERVMDLRGGLSFAVRLEAPQTVMLDRAFYDDARWVPFHSAAALMSERDKKDLRRLNRLLDVFLQRVDVVFEEFIEPEGCSSGGCGTSGGGCGTSGGGCSTGGCGTKSAGETSSRGCGSSPFLDGHEMSGKKVPGWMVDGGAGKGCAGCSKSSSCGTGKKVVAAIEAHNHEHAHPEVTPQA